MAKGKKVSGNPFVQTNGGGHSAVAVEDLVNTLVTAYNFQTMVDTEEVFYLDGGVYKCGGEAVIKVQVESRVALSRLVTTHLVQEVVNHIRRRTYKRREAFDAEPYILNVRNGLLDIRTGQLLPHSAGFLSTVQLPVTYDPAADCPLIKQFRAQILKPEDIPVIEEQLGDMLRKDCVSQSGFIYYSPGESGKSTLINLFTAFLGEANCAHISLQDLAGGPFYVAELYGKLANLYADLPSKALQDTSIIKALMGGDFVKGEYKFQKPFFFRNFAKLVFSTNQPPRVFRDEYAFWRRWKLIEFPNVFPEGKRDPHILEKLTTEEELSGLLNLALKGLQRLMTNCRFSYGLTPLDVAERYTNLADPVIAFLDECCSADAEGWVTKKELYAAFVDFCKDKKLSALPENTFGQRMHNQKRIPVSNYHPDIGGGQRVMAWKGIKLNV